MTATMALEMIGYVLLLLSLEETFTSFLLYCMLYYLFYYHTGVFVFWGFFMAFCLSLHCADLGAGGWKGWAWMGARTKKKRIVFHLSRVR